jgi:hypothetical protein
MANSNGWGDGAANNAIGWGQGANNAIAWGDSHAKSWAGATDIVGLTTDPAASAFIAATGITGATQQAAINNLVKGLKADGLWSKMKAVYPFVTDNRNLLSYTEDFSNAFWTKNNTTVTANTTTAPNGTTTADTLSDGLTNNFHYIPSANSLGVNGNNTLSIYAKANTLNYLYLYFYNGTEPSGATAWFNLSNGTVGTVQSGLTASIENAGNGWYRCSITRNFNFTATNSNCGLGISNADNVGSYLGTNKTLFVWGAQLELGSSATTYQPIATTQQAFIASQFKYNLVNPVDSDAAFRLVFNGGWTHSSTGATPNGTNGYADTKLVPSTVFPSINNGSFGMYFNTNRAAANIAQGAYSSANSSIVGMYPRYSGDIFYGYINTHNGAASTTTAVNTLGFRAISRTSSTNNILQYNGNQNNATQASLGNTVHSVYLGALNYAGVASDYDSIRIAFNYLSESLSSTELGNLYSRVNTFQTALSRNV